MNKPSNTKLRELLDEAREVRKSGAFNYEYLYIKDIVLDENLNNKYGSSRESYEQFKQDFIDLDIQISNQNSLRALNSGKNGYILETKISNDNDINKLFKMFEQAKTELIKELDVIDIEAFEYYLDTRLEYNFIDFRTRINNLVQAINDLYEILEEYYEDIDFRNFIDKIKN